MRLGTRVDNGSHFRVPVKSSLENLGCHKRDCDLENPLKTLNPKHSTPKL